MTGMTVKQLIEALTQIQNQDMEVYFDEGAVSIEVSSVSVNKWNARDGSQFQVAVLS
jgi:hypothetical protein